MATRPWLKLDVPLLDDEDFLAMSDRLIGVWTKAYLLCARDGDQIKNRARLAWLLGRHGTRNPEQAVRDLDAAGWLEDVGDGAITIRGYRKYQLVYRGPSDLPEAKAERNAKRPTTRAGRGASGERVERAVARGAGGGGRGPARVGATRASGARGSDRGEEMKSKNARALAPEGAGSGSRARVGVDGPLVSFGEMMAKMGLDPQTLKLKEEETATPHLLTDAEGAV